MGTILGFGCLISYILAIYFEKKGESYYVDIGGTSKLWRHNKYDRFVVCAGILCFILFICFNYFEAKEFHKYDTFNSPVNEYVQSFFKFGQTNAEKQVDMIRGLTMKYIKDLDNAKTKDEADRIRREYYERLKFESRKISDEEKKEYERNMSWEEKKNFEDLEQRVNDAENKANYRLN